MDTLLASPLLLAAVRALSVAGFGSHIFDADTLDGTKATRADVNHRGYTVPYVAAHVSVDGNGRITCSAASDRSQAPDVTAIRAIVASVRA